MVGWKKIRTRQCAAVSEKKSKTRFRLAELVERVRIKFVSFQCIGLNIRNLSK